jgi:hypothetical protein
MMDKGGAKCPTFFMEKLEVILMSIFSRVIVLGALAVHI